MTEQEKERINRIRSVIAGMQSLLDVCYHYDMGIQIEYEGGKLIDGIVFGIYNNHVEVNDSNADNHLIQYDTITAIAVDWDKDTFA